ncbi:nucleotide sugar dehydrogenase [Nonomuraea sp. GTA35]|uniref:nucleotide sugar dehydrogenase n=1 Tax=Nonomuraea sp. GTA35 TaxID=1676746 RepID=UPI0035C21A20
MNVGWIGLGKLGAPCALALQHLAGHDVLGYDVRRQDVERLFADPSDHGEEGFGALIELGPLKLAHTIGEVVAHADVVFVAVQTPHAPAYGGETPMPEERRDFEYGYLIQAVRDVCRAAADQAKPITLVVVSTVLPGTCNKHLRGLLNPFVTLVYSPLFIAMGSTLKDFREPEFVLMGADSPESLAPVAAVYAALHDRPVFRASIETAELIKVAYNTFISMKIVWANTMMEICHKTGADCDQLVNALTLATDRVISPAYMRGGMGDGGACHPRDMIAMSWLAERLNLSYDLLGQMAYAREAQSGWLADLTERWAEQTGFDIAILGKAYKPGTALTAGSPALLLAHQLAERGHDVVLWDAPVDSRMDLTEPAVFVVGTKHPANTSLKFPPGTVVLDPFGYMPDQPGVTVIRVGRKS